MTMRSKELQLLQQYACTSNAAHQQRAAPRGTVKFVSTIQHHGNCSRSSVAEVHAGSQALLHTLRARHHSPCKPLPTLVHMFLQHPRTLVNALFGGILQSQVRCLVCGHVSATWDPCMDISLELGAACSSVEDALGRFTAVEKLDGDNKYRWVWVCKDISLSQQQQQQRKERKNAAVRASGCVDGS